MFSNADAVVEQQDGTVVFVEPYERDEVFGDFLRYIRADRLSKTQEGQRAVKCAQTRSCFSTHGIESGG